MTRKSESVSAKQQKAAPASKKKRSKKKAARKKKASAKPATAKASKKKKAADKAHRSATETQTHAQSEPVSGTTDEQAIHKPGESAVQETDVQAARDGAKAVPVKMEDSTPDDSFVYILDEPKKADGAAGAELQLGDDNDDSFLILFDNDDDPVDDEPVLEIGGDGACSISLPTDIRLSKLNALKDCFLNSLDAKNVEVNASRVKRMDTASFQLLWSYSARLKETNIPL